MAIYRSDQAQFSFAPEAYDGGMPESASLVAGDLTTQVSSTNTAIAVNGAKVGDRSISITSGHRTNSACVGLRPIWFEV